MGLIKEFREFISRGNVVDLAVGVIIGGAFGNIVNSLVKDVIMPPIGWLTSGIDFSSLKFNLPAIKVPDPLDPAKLISKPEVAVAYGNFLNTIITFIILASVIFWVVKGVNILKRHEAAKPEPPVPTPQEKLLMEIRDLLAKEKAS